MISFTICMFLKKHTDHFATSYLKRKLIFLLIREREPLTHHIS